jgi:hypothetical protein
METNKKPEQQYKVEIIGFVKRGVVSEFKYQTHQWVLGY